MDRSDDNKSSSSEVESVTSQLKIHKSKSEVTAYVTSPRKPRQRDFSPQPTLSPLPSTVSTTVGPLPHLPSSSKMSLESQLEFFRSLIGLLHYLQKKINIQRLNVRIQQTVALDRYPKPQCLLHWIKSDSHEDFKVSSLFKVFRPQIKY
jgi:hypothetical protein